MSGKYVAYLLKYSRFPIERVIGVRRYVYFQLFCGRPGHAAPAISIAIALLSILPARASGAPVSSCREDAVPWNNGCVQDHGFALIQSALRTARRFQSSTLPTDLQVLKGDISPNFDCNEFFDMFAAKDKVAKDKVDVELKKLACATDSHAVKPTNVPINIVYVLQREAALRYHWRVSVAFHRSFISSRHSVASDLTMATGVAGRCPNDEELQAAGAFGPSEQVHDTDPGPDLRYMDLGSVNNRRLVLEFMDLSSSMPPFCSIRISVSE